MTEFIYFCLKLAVVIIVATAALLTCIVLFAVAVIALTKFVEWVNEL